jgi:2-iminobutanoate/2-iminopropanoate deaminase
MRLTALVMLALLAPAALAAQDRQAVYPSNARTAGPYTPGIKAGGTLYMSGQLGVAPGTRTLVAGGIGPETRAALENIGRVLEAAGMSYARVAKCTVFLADINDFAAMNEVYTTFFPNEPPARSTVAVAGLVLSARVEIECIAA